MQHRIDFMAIPEIGELQTGPHIVSLWSVLSMMLQGPAEIDFFRSLLGDTITRNLSAAEELHSLLEILSDLRDPDAASNSPKDEPFSSSPSRNPIVPLASVNKELLQERLRRLIATARAPVEELFKTPRERRVAEMLVRPPSSVGSSSRSRDSRPTSCGSGSSRSTYINPTQDLAPLKGNLHFDKMDRSVKSAVLDCFHAEHEQILSDITIIRGLIDAELEKRTSVAMEPTVQELKDMTKCVEEAELHLRHVEKIQNLPVPVKRGSLAALK